MADIKVIYKNSDGLDQEHSPAQDSVQMLSFKTANKELTDAKLSHLIDGADASDEHIHDGRYYRKNEHVAASSGSPDAGKGVITSSNGKLSNTLIDIPQLNSALSHSALTNLNADDHVQYLRTDGQRDVTGLMKYSTLVAVTDDKSIPTKKYVDEAILTANLGQEWYDSVITRIINPQASPVAGSRYLIDGSLGTPTGAWTGKANQVATWNGSTWVYQIPQSGTFVPVDNEPNVLYTFGGSAWVPKSFEVTTASTGLIKNSFDIQIDPAAAGAGLGFTGGVFNVNVDGTGIEINADTLRLKDAGVKAAKIDFGTGAGQVSGAQIPLADVGSFFPTDNVESALQFVASELLSVGGYYVAGSGGVTKGSMVYLSGADTVSSLSNLSNSAEVIGIAMSSVSAGQPVKVLANDTILKSVLTGATAGTRYYWTGSGYSTATPGSLGSHVWQVGVAKNATDLAVAVNFVKRNTLL